MRRLPLILLATTAIGLASSQVASAADLPVKAPPQYVPPFNWTGPYIGGFFGYGWGDNTVVDHEGASSIDRTTSSLLVPAPAPTGPGFGTHDYNINGFLGGAAVGWNWQVNPWLVLGIESGVTWTGIDDTAACGSFTCRTEMPWMFDITGRVGYAVDRALFYVKGGGVWAHSEYTKWNSVLGYATATDTRFGWVVGAGIEYAFLPNWSAKIEYNFIDFGTQTETFTFYAPCCATVYSDIDQQIQFVKAGINYRFKWP
jgi:outer membrane immunogenic protein